MNIIAQIALLAGVCWGGVVLEKLLPFPFPAGILALLLLLALLCCRVVKPDRLKQSSDFLLGNMTFFFIPAGVNILNYVDLLKSSALQMILICLITTVLVYWSTSAAVRLTLRLMKGKGDAA